MSDKPVVLVTAVGAPPGLNALRALVESDRYTVIACDADPRSPGLYQFGVPHAVVPLATKEPESYLAALCQIIRENNVKAVLPCIEGEVSFLAGRSKDIEAAGARVLLPDQVTVEAAMDKYAATLSAERNGIPCPATIFIPVAGDRVHRIAAVNRFMSRCQPPWIVKPVHGHGMADVETLTSLSHAIEYIDSVQHDVLVQEKIPGPLGSMHLVGLIYDGEGNVARRFSSRSIRTLFPRGGPATAGISLRNDALVEQTVRLINSLGTWRGPANVEWMLDPRDGQFKFIEINPRLWGYGYLAVGSGTNFPVTTIEFALGRDPGPDQGFREGVTMLRTTVDIIFDECPFKLDY